MIFQGGLDPLPPPPPWICLCLKLVCSHVAQFRTTLRAGQTCKLEEVVETQHSQQARRNIRIDSVHVKFGKDSMGPQNCIKWRMCLRNRPHTRAWAEPENSIKGVHQLILQRVVWTSLKKQLDPGGPIASQRGSIPVFIMKPLTTCDYPGGSWPPVQPPPPLVWQAAPHHHPLAPQPTSGSLHANEG